MYLGIDLGTTGLKAVLLRESGVIAGIGYQEYPIDIPKPGYAQQNPALWWNALQVAVRQAMIAASAASSDVLGIGLSGQMHGLVPLGEAGTPLCPAIIWCDQRSAAQSARVREQLGVETMGKWVQNPISAGFQAASLLWLREENPALYRRMHTALLPKDYLRYRLTGEVGTEPTDACSTLLFDCVQRVWSKAILDALDIDGAILPDAAHRPTEIAGALTREAAEVLGLCSGTPVAYGGGDQPMQAIGNGILRPGDASVTIGTGGQILMPTAVPKVDPHLRTHTFCHASENLWYVMGATLSAGLSLNWFARQVLGGAI